MKLRMLASGLVAAFLVLSPATVAQANYPGPVITIDVGGGVFYGGDPVPVTATSSTVDCTWNLTLAINGESANGPLSTSFSHTFGSPVVSEVTQTSVTATCVYDDGLGPASFTGDSEAAAVPAFYTPGTGVTVQTAERTTSVTAAVTLLPREAGDGDGDENAGGLLPGTGGASLWILLAGAALLVIGGAVTVAARRRSAGR